MNTPGRSVLSLMSLLIRRSGCTCVLVRPRSISMGGRTGPSIYSLADAAFSVLGNNTNNVSVALDCSITYHASPEPGSFLVVEGQNLSTNRRTGSYIFTVYTEKDGDRTLIATMKSVSYRTGRPIDPDADR